jgi:hypothetical protein
VIRGVRGLFEGALQLAVAIGVVLRSKVDWGDWKPLLDLEFGEFQRLYLLLLQVSTELGFCHLAIGADWELLGLAKSGFRYRAFRLWRQL